ncbi:MAG: leucyl aminopeptidase, partial [Gammaproteobacteria bacterium]
NTRRGNLLMKFELSQQSPTMISTQCLMIGIFENSELTPSAQLIDKSSNNLLNSLIAQGDFSGETGQTLILHHLTGISAERVMLVGMGAKDKLSANSFYKATQAALAALVKLPVSQAACMLSEIDVPNTNEGWRIRIITQLAETTNYKFDQFKSQKSAKTNLLANLQIASQTDQTLAINTGKAIGHGVNLARQLGNMPANICTPAYLAEQAVTLTYEFPIIKVNILETEQLKELKMGALLAVGQGSHVPPRLIEINYHGAPSDQAPIVLVGKGITFDSGGISLKPPAGMEDMKFDMCGAASVIGTIHAIAELKLPINVIGLIPTAENMPDGNSYRPGDILTSMSGQTIEVNNTDAEGRLILCDALTYAERFKPATVIDIATLTGAMVISLGYLLNGIFSNQDELAQELLAAGKRSNDLGWHMPIVEEYQDAIKSNYADMVNSSKVAGAITATCFLSRFTKQYRWAHIDCAGTAMPSDAAKAGGATGRPVPLLVEYLLYVCAC